MSRGKLAGMAELPKDRLRTARIEAGFRSARSAALRHRWHPSTYASHENGQTAKIPQDAAELYAKAFNVSAGWLLTGEGDKRATVTGDELVALVKSIPAERRATAIEVLQALATSGPQSRRRR